MVRVNKRGDMMLSEYLTCQYVADNASMPMLPSYTTVHACCLIGDSNVGHRIAQTQLHLTTWLQTSLTLVPPSENP